MVNLDRNKVVALLSDRLHWSRERILKEIEAGNLDADQDRPCDHPEIEACGQRVIRTCLIDKCVKIKDEGAST